MSPESFGLGIGLGFVLLIALGVCLAIGLFVHWIWMLVDCAQAPHDRNDPHHRLLWLLIMIFTGWLGSILYHVIVRRARLAQPTVPPVFH